MWILGGAGDLAAELGAELAEHGRDVDTDLLEHAAMHQSHGAAATILAAGAGLAFPVLTGEATGRKLAVGACELILDLLERGTNPLAQRSEPSCCFGLPAVDGRVIGERRLGASKLATFVVGGVEGVVDGRHEVKPNRDVSEIEKDEDVALQEPHQPPP